MNGYSIKSFKLSRFVNIIYLIILFIKIHQRVKCDPIVYDLIHTILKDYDYSIRPSLTHNSTLNVTFGFALIQLIDVVSQIFLSFFLLYL
jgi:hypothetical protein